MLDSFQNLQNVPMVKTASLICIINTFLPPFYSPSLIILPSSFLFPESLDCSLASPLSTLTPGYSMVLPYFPPQCRIPNKVKENTLLERPGRWPLPFVVHSACAICPFLATSSINLRASQLPVECNVKSFQVRPVKHIPRRCQN